MECSEANVKKIKKCLSNIIDKEESILEYATVKLSVCSPQTEKVFRSFIKEGILCVVINRNTSCLYLQLFELIEFHKVFEIELYTNISDGYTVRDNYFHIIEYPGFFLGLSFPLIENPNANRSTLIQKTIISMSKFISINLSDYIYSHKFDYEKISSKKISKMKTYNKNGFKPSTFKEDKQKFVKINDSKSVNKNELELLSNKIISVNVKDDKNENDTIKKYKSANITNNINNKLNKQKDNISDSHSSHSKSNSVENDSISISSKKNNLEGSNNNQDTNKDKSIKGILKKSIQSKNSIIMKNEIQNNNNEKEKSQIVESKEKMFFDNITIEDSNDKKIYKIVQFHVLKDKMKLVKKLFKKNFYRFINSNKISFEKIKHYKINTYDFLNEEDYSSEEDEGKKTFVDYVPSNDMFGMLENQDIQDERLLELMQQRKNLKEISKKRDNDIPIKTTSIYN